MAKHTISEAARLTGKARSTIHKHIKDGKISKEHDKDGNPVIDTSELERAYGSLQTPHDSATDRTLQDEIAQSDRGSQALWDEVQTLRAEKIETLECRIRELESERDDWKAQAERALTLLTDQRPKSAAPIVTTPSQTEPPPESAGKVTEGRLTIWQWLGLASR